MINDNLALLINSNDLNRVGLNFSNPKSFAKIFGMADKNNVERMVSFLLALDENKPQIYLIGDVVKSVINVELPSGDYGSTSYSVPYKTISLAVANGNSRKIANAIYALYDSDSAELKKTAKKLLGDDLISFSPTLGEPISSDNIPTYSFRATWDSIYPSGFSNNLPKNIVVGLYDNFRV